jgi:hypothetical protein
VYPKVSGLVTWSENCKWYSSLPLGTVCIVILWVSLVSFAAITLCVASQQVFIVVSVYFFIDSVRKLFGTPSYVYAFLVAAADWWNHSDCPSRTGSRRSQNEESDGTRSYFYQQFVRLALAMEKGLSCSKLHSNWEEWWRWWGKVAGRRWEIQFVPPRLDWAPDTWDPRNLISGSREAVGASSAVRSSFCWVKTEKRRRKS